MPAPPSPSIWIGRGLLALLALTLAYRSGADTLGAALASADPARAHRLAADNGRITALLAASMSGAQATADDRRHADLLAREALRQDPIDVTAVATLGLNADARGDANAARRLFQQAQLLSRRNRLTQLWAIEDAVSRNDIPGALRQYDIALRTTPDTSALLFPVLASASATPEIRAELARTLARRPVWANDFIYYLAQKAPDPASAASLFLAVRHAGGVVLDSAWAGAVNALIERHQLDQAWSTYAAIRPGADRHHVRDPRFALDLDTPTQFDWIAVNNGSINAAIQDGIFDFTAPPSVGGVLLRQVQVLPPGEYRLAGHSREIEQVDDALPYWSLTCRDGRELGRTVVTNSSRTNGYFTGRFRVPADCPVQTLSLTARPSDVAGGLSGQIDRLELGPVS